MTRADLWIHVVTAVAQSFAVQHDRGLDWLGSVIADAEDYQPRFRQDFGHVARHYVYWQAGHLATLEPTRTTRR